jgi:hypothetical protein
MFGSSYSEGALDKFSKVVSELNNSIERQLAEYPVDGIKLQSEMIVESFGDIFDKQKKIDQENKQIWTAGIWMYLLDYYYDGKPSHHDKFTKAAIRPLSPIGKNNLFKKIKKYSKYTNNIFYKSGRLWGEEFNERFLSDSLWIQDNEFEIEDEEIDFSFFGKEGKIITVIAPKDKSFYQKGKILIDQTFFDRRNPDNESTRQHDLRYVNELDMHLNCRRGESNIYFELYSDEDINGIFDPYSDIEHLGYDDELTIGKEIFQFETQDKSLPDQIELKVRRSKRFSDDLLRDVEYEIEKILKKYNDPLSNNQETLWNSNKYKDKINFSDSSNKLNLDYLNELCHSNEIIIEQILEDLIEHLNNFLDMNFEIITESKQFKGLSDLKIMHEGYCFLRRRKRMTNIDHDEWRYGWESTISEQRHFNNNDFGINFITESLTNVSKYFFDGMLDDPDSRLNLESIYSSFHDFKKYSLHKLNPISNECYELFGEFKLRFYEWMRLNNKFDFVFLVVMINPLQKDDYNVDSKVILKMEGNTKINQCKINGMSLIEDSFDSENGYFSEDYVEYFEAENKIDRHLIQPLKVLMENKTEENSYSEIYSDNLKERVLVHGDFVKYPRDEIIKAFNKETVE